MERSWVVKGTSFHVLAVIMIWQWWRFVLSKCLKSDDCLWILGGEGAPLRGYLNEYSDFRFLFKFKLTK